MKENSCEQFIFSLQKESFKETLILWCGSFENWANELWESHLFPNPYVLFCVFELSQLALIAAT